MRMMKTLAVVRGTPLPPAKPLWLALLVMILICSITHATEPRQQGSAAWAVVMAKHRLTMKINSSATKSCTCSSQCSCGCNTRQPCQCGTTTTSSSTGCTMINGVMVCPNK
ncbi:MAG TPA: hypothetical protein PLN21_06040 [Gemmatales bacterium]|nr:hypothetical protein [Gemmatales bacterium]